jgi:hypothetical protein
MRSTLDGLGSGVSLVRYEAVQLPFLAQARVQIILRPKSRTAAETEDPGEAHKSVSRSGDSKHPSARSALARRMCIGAIWQHLYCIRLSEGAYKSSAQKAPSAATCNSALERYRNSQTGSRKHAVI